MTSRPSTPTTPEQRSSEPEAVEEPLRTVLRAYERTRNLRPMKRPRRSGDV